MPQRVPPQEIDRIKRDVSLERLVEAAGIELKRHGADLHGLCPFP
jgi:DNA primase